LPPGHACKITFIEVMAQKVKPEMNMTIKSILATTVRAATTVVGFCMVLTASAHAQAEHFTRTIKNHTEVAIGGYVRWNNDCEPKESPEVILDVAPTNGIVCARTSIVTVRTVREGKAVHCVGRSIRGINVIYLPRSGFTGVDVIRYTVKFNVVKQAFDVDIRVASDHTITGNDGVPPSSEAPQTPGPVPLCAALVS
jgi:hypothetical protein